MTKIIRDKNNNDVMKLLMMAGPERPATPTRLYKLTPGQQQQKKIITANQASPSSQAVPARVGGSGSPGNKMTSSDGANLRYAAMKSGVFLRTFHTLYRCKKAEDEIAGHWKEETGSVTDGRPASMPQ